MHMYVCVCIFEACIKNKKGALQVNEWMKQMIIAVTIHLFMALNSLQCADVPLRKYSLSL